MNSLNKKEPLILLIGDLLFLIISLWIALFLRSFTFPDKSLFITHLVPFSYLFLVWILGFYIAGLYEKHTVLLRSRLSVILLKTQVFNSVLAIIFFYFIPLFGITPKTILFIYLIVSFLLILSWRTYGYFAVGSEKTENALLIGSGSEMRELFEEVNSNPLYQLKFISSVDLERVEDDTFWDEIVSRIYAENVSLIAIDLANEKVAPVLPHLYNLIFSKVKFVDMHKLYESVFSRVPLSLLKYNWFLENISTAPRATYDALKRIMDILIAIPALIISVPFILFGAIAIKLEDGGEIFSFQKRVGRNNKLVNLVKLRTMNFNDDGDWHNRGKTNEVTQIGKLLRKTRIDELPQLWNVLAGEVSLIGPRPEFEPAVKKYEEEIPYYNIRHLIKPGLSGWAQIYHEDHPHHGDPENTRKTKDKLSYDLYYIKNRSFFLDLKIALKTIKTLLSRVGI